MRCSRPFLSGARRPAAEVLGLASTPPPSAEDVRRAFRESAKEHHPDVGGDAERFKELRGAYEELLRGDGSMADDAESRDGGQRDGPGKSAHAHGRGGGEYPNYSTRDFYRPYESRGFTAQEIRMAHELNMRVALRRILWNVLMFMLAYIVLLRPIVKKRREERQGGETHEERNERLRREYLLRRAKPSLKEHWTEAQKQAYLQRWNEDFEWREQRANAGWLP